MTAALFAGASPAFADPQIPRDPDRLHGCATALAKGGPRSCTGSGSQLTEIEKDCFQGAVTGLIPGLILRNPKEAAVAAIGGCVSSATAD